MATKNKPAKPAPGRAVKVANVPPAPARPATPPVINQSGAADTFRTSLRAVSAAAANVSIAREVLIERIRAVSTNPDATTLAAIRGAVFEGYCAGRIARAAGRMTATPEDHAAAIVLLAKANVGAAKPAKLGKRTEDEERIFGSARALWHTLSVSAGAAKEAGTGEGRSAGGKASGAKRAAQAGGKAAGTASVKVGGAAKAAGTKTGPTLTKNIVAMRSAPEAVSGAMHIASHLLAFADANAKMLGSEAADVCRGAARMVLNLKMPAA